jgi:hypothetical protein
MIEPPHVDADITLHHGDLQKRLIAGQILILQNENAADGDLPLDRLTLEFQVVRT